MSNTQYLGTNAGFYYYVYTATTWLTFPLAVPLREGRPSYRVVQYAADSLDLSRRQVLNVESSAGGNLTGAFEYLGVLRYNDDMSNNGLMDFLKAATLQSGSTTYPLRYTTGLTTGTTSGGVGPGADVWLIEPTAFPFDTQLDRQRASFGDIEVSCRFRSMVATQNFSTGSGARWF